MDKTLEAQIADAEEKLRLAMLASDIGALDELLSPKLIFTDHLGQRLGKEEDLAVHQSGALVIFNLKLSDLLITSADEDVAVVSVRAHIDGTYGGQPAGGRFRFTRVWVRATDKKWQVLAAHSSVIA